MLIEDTRRASGAAPAGLGGRRGRPGTRGAADPRWCAAPRGGSAVAKSCFQPDATAQAWRQWRRSAAGRTRGRSLTYLGCVGRRPPVPVDEPTSKSLSAAPDGGPHHDRVVGHPRRVRVGVVSTRARRGPVRRCVARRRQTTRFAGSRLARGRSGGSRARHWRDGSCGSIRCARPTRCNSRRRSRRRKAGRPARRC